MDGNHILNDLYTILHEYYNNEWDRASLAWEYHSLYDFM